MHVSSVQNGSLPNQPSLLDTVSRAFYPFPYVCSVLGGQVKPTVPIDESGWGKGKEFARRGGKLKWQLGDLKRILFETNRDVAENSDRQEMEGISLNSFFSFLQHSLTRGHWFLFEGCAQDETDTKSI